MINRIFLWFVGKHSYFEILVFNDDYFGKGPFLEGLAGEYHFLCRYTISIHTQKP